MSDFDHLRTTYFDECAELLDAAYIQLAAIEEGHANGDSVHAVFRAIHSIKGGGGIFGFDRLVAFAHVFETVLDLLREGRLALAPPVAALLLRSTDVLADLVTAARTGEDKPPGFEDEVLGALRAAADSPAATPTQNQPEPVHAEPAAYKIWTQRYRIRFVPHAGLFRNANDPLLIIRELKRLGQVEVEADLSRLPTLATIDPAEAYLAWTLHIQTIAPATALHEAFEFAGDDCDLLIEAEDGADDTAPARPETPPPPPPPAAEPVKPAEAPDAAPAAAPSIRIDVERVDRLVNLVGELVINQAMLVQLGGNLPPELCSGLLNGLDTMSQLLRELQDGVMAIRAQPVRSVFSRMSRLVRELSAHLGKEVSLVVSGEGTEIDKTVIEQLTDPLTHLLRNALDHGIESPDEREEHGKPRHGTIHLSAAHRGGRIVIEVADDGQGIPREKVLARARSRGLVSPDAIPSDEEIDNLIFLPGFSTSDVVSDVSGRGVGMDVVKRNIQALGGRIGVESRAGLGSRFVLSLPLTLAILDGMAVAVGRESYIIPLANIMESLRPKRESIHPVVGRGDVLAIRGEYVPLVYLYRRLLVPDAMTDPCQGIVVIVESEGAGKVGLVVDELLGQQQVVVKSLEANYGPVDGIGGATILGDGRVALILDVNRLQETPAAAMSPQRLPVASQQGSAHLQ